MVRNKKDKKMDRTTGTIVGIVTKTLQFFHNFCTVMKINKQLILGSIFTLFIIAFIFGGIFYGLKLIRKPMPFVEKPPIEEVVEEKGVNQEKVKIEKLREYNMGIMIRSRIFF